MKKIMILLVLLGTLSCSKSISQIKDLQAISEAPKVNLPYGDKDVLYNFPNEWTTANTAPDAAYNKLGQLYEDLENPNRKKITAYYFEISALLAKEFIPSEAVKNKKEKLEIKIAKVFTVSGADVYSIVYQGKIDCKNCEYPESQIQNVLVSIKGGKITDKLPISYVNGSDLARSARFFYMDENSIIHVKDFKSDEEGVAFTAYSKFKFDSDGKFTKL